MFELYENAPLFVLVTMEKKIKDLLRQPRKIFVEDFIFVISNFFSDPFNIKFENS